MNDQPSGSRWESADSSPSPDHAETQPITAAESAGSDSLPPAQAPADPAEPPDLTGRGPEDTTALGGVSRRDRARATAVRGGRWAGARKGLLGAAAALILFSGSAGFALGRDGDGGGGGGRDGISPANLERGEDGREGPGRGGPGGPGRGDGDRRGPGDGTNT